MLKTQSGLTHTQLGEHTFMLVHFLHYQPSEPETYRKIFKAIISVIISQKRRGEERGGICFVCFKMLTISLLIESRQWIHVTSQD